MIKTIKDFFERRRMRMVFGKYVSSSVANDLLSGKLKSPQVGQFDDKPLGVVLVLVGYSGDIAKNMESVSDLAREHGAGYETMTNGLMIFCYGRFPAEQNIQEQRQAFVASLRLKLGKAIKVVHGTGTGKVGLVGSKSFLTIFTFIMPKFGEAISLLTSLYDGEVREFVFS
jgi:hypothetical protein